MTKREAFFKAFKEYWESDEAPSELRDITDILYDIVEGNDEDNDGKPDSWYPYFYLATSEEAEAKARELGLTQEMRKQELWFINNVNEDEQYFTDDYYNFYSPEKLEEIRKNIEQHQATPWRLFICINNDFDLSLGLTRND